MRKLLLTTLAGLTIVGLPYAALAQSDGSTGPNGIDPTGQTSSMPEKGHRTFKLFGFFKRHRGAPSERMSDKGRITGSSSTTPHNPSSEIPLQPAAGMTGSSSTTTHNPSY